MTTQHMLRPFTSPIHVILCLLYPAALLAFIVLFLANWPGTTSAPFLWPGAIAVALLIFSIVVNWYVVTVTLIYMTMSIGLLVIIGLILVASILVCITSCSNSNNTNNNN